MNPRTAVGRTMADTPMRGRKMPFKSGGKGERVPRGPGLRSQTLSGA
jgi:hypothetical protein